MYVNRSYLRELFQKLVEDQCSDEELDEFLRLMRSLPADDPLIEALDAHWQSVYNHHDQPENAIGSRIHENILSKIRPGGTPDASSPQGEPVPDTIHLPGARSNRIHRRWIAAAAILVMIAGIYLMVLVNSERTANLPSVETAAAIQPGKNGAILTLADGRQLVLDSAGNGVLAMQHNTQVVLRNGQLVYEATKNWSGEILYNNMSTPKGRQFQLVLPDGTRVWLNAQSSIRYPTVFGGPERVVEITGEAYFEIAKNKLQPFLVRVHGQAEVQALGTQFNIKAYADEEGLSTTLVEGSVRVASLAGGHTRKNSQSVILRPNEQALIRPDSGSITVKSTNIDRVTAWKNGYFNFEETSFREILRQLERWYDIEVVLEGDAPNIQFFGEMSKNIELEDLLEGLAASGVHFRIEAGRRLVVSR